MLAEVDANEACPLLHDEADELVYLCFLGGPTGGRGGYACSRGGADPAELPEEQGGLGAAAAHV